MSETVGEYKKGSDAMIGICAVVAGGLAIAAAGISEAPLIHTVASEPAARALAELPRQIRISQFGITWTFATEVPVRQFVNGDYYVVGPATVVSIDPAPVFGDDVPTEELDAIERHSQARQADHAYVRNGTMLNPPAAQASGLDSGVRNWYRPDLARRLPISLQPGDTLVSSISLKQGEESEFPYHGSGAVRGENDNSPVKTVAVLTCVAEPLPPDAFRPSWADHRESAAERRIYLARNLRRELLPRLPRPDGDRFAIRESRPTEFATDLDLWVRVFQRPWFNPGFFGFDQPMNNMPHYGQWVGQAMSVAGLILLTDLPEDQRERLLIGVVQVGVDYWGAVRAGHPGWEGWGGHGSGRKFPIVFAGLLLGDDAMASPTRTFPQVNFGEDNQTMYARTFSGAEVAFAGHSGIHADSSIPRANWGPYEHLHPSAWDQPGQDNFQSDAYRRANTSSSWVGQALVMRLLHAEEHWSQDAFFDYVDRWMYEDDREQRLAIAAAFPKSGFEDDTKSWRIQGYTWEPFVEQMWDRYRSTVAAATDGWKRPPMSAIQH